MSVHFPLQVTFGQRSLANVLSIHDATGSCVAQAHSRWWRAKLAVEVYADEAKSRPLARIETDDVIDFAGSYRFVDPNGQLLGRSRRRGVRSILRVRHDIDAGSNGVEPWQLKEERPWVRFFDSVLGRIPFIGMFAGYVFNPTYLVRRGDEPIVRIRQRRAFMEGKFTLEQLAGLEESEQLRALLAALTFLLIERTSRARFSLPSGGGGSVNTGALWR